MLEARVFHIIQYDVYSYKGSNALSQDSIIQQQESLHKNTMSENWKSSRIKYNKQISLLHFSQGAVEY